MSLHRKCCCGCNSIWRVFEPCEQTTTGVDAQRVVTTVTGLDLEYGEGQWQEKVYLFNGQCACDAYCGVWTCDSRANAQDEDDEYINICDSVPCDTAFSDNPCPECNDDEELPFVMVRPADLNRFTEVEDCCDDACPSTCESGNPIPSNGCSAYGWTHGDLTYHDPELTTGTMSWTGLYNQQATFRVDSYQIVDEVEALPTDNLNFSFKEWLVKVSYTTTMDISAMEEGGRCINPQTDPYTVVSGYTHIQVRVTPCRVRSNGEGGSCLTINTNVSGGSSSLANFTWHGNTYSNDWGIACDNPNGSFPERIGWRTQTYSSDPLTEECATFGDTVETTRRMNVSTSQLGGYPLGGDFDGTSFTDPSALWEWSMKVTYPEEPTP